jgi:hypothetical protein
MKKYCFKCQKELRQIPTEVTFATSNVFVCEDDKLVYTRVPALSAANNDTWVINSFPKSTDGTCD